MARTFGSDKNINLDIEIIKKNSLIQSFHYKRIIPTDILRTIGS